MTVRSFADELHAMVTALEQAVGIASTLQQLHEAEVCLAESEMRAKAVTLSQHLTNSQPSGVVQQGIMGDKPQSETSPASGNLSRVHLPCQAIEEEHATLLENDLLRNEDRSCCMLKQAFPTAHEDLPGVDEDHTASGKADLPSSGTTYSLVTAPSATSVLAYHQGSSERISHMALRELGDPPQADLGSPASEGLLNSETPTSAALGFQRGNSKQSFSLGSLRGIWADVEQTPADVLAVLGLRIFVNIVHHEEDDRRAASFSRMFTLRRKEMARSQAEICCNGIHTFACGIMSPVGPIRLFWNVMSLLFIVYDLLAVPMQVFNIEDDKGVQVFEWILTIWWTFDVYMTFRTGYVVGAVIEMRPRKIACNYVRTWLVVDIIIVIIEWINRLAFAIGSASLLRSSRALRMFRCLRLFRASKIWGFWQTLQDQVLSNIFTLCTTMLALGGILILTIHVTACIWYAIGDSRDDGWIAFDLYEGEKDHLFWYMASFRWVVAQFNGRTDLDERRNMVERFFTCTTGVILAVVANAVFISFITKTMLDLTELVSEKTERRRLVNQYLTANPLPSALSSHVKRCLHDYQDVNQELQKEDRVLAILPKHLQIDVLENVRAPVLMLHPFFRALPAESPWVMPTICRKVVQMISTTKDEVLFDTNDMCERMLFFDKLTAIYGDHRINFECEDVPSTGMAMSFFRDQRSGSSAKLVACSHGKKPKKIGMGSWISEVALWIEWRNRGCLVSDGHGVLFAVGAYKLAEELKKYPHAFALAVFHSKHFLLELPKHSPHKISDVLPFEVHVFSPLCLKITILSASDLRNADTWMAGKSDPYCVCKIIDVRSKSSKACFKTKVLNNTLDPVWNHSSKIYMSWHQVIEFQIYDYDLADSDDLLGIARISAEDLSPSGYEEHVSLVKSDGTICQGSLHVKIETTEAEDPSLYHLWHPHLREKSVI